MLKEELNAIMIGFGGKITVICSCAISALKAFIHAEYKPTEENKELIAKIQCRAIMPIKRMLISLLNSLDRGEYHD